MSLNPSDKEIQEPKVVPTRNNAKYDFIKCLENQAVGNNAKRNTIPLDFCAVAEDVLVQKEYKEMRCEIPGIPRSTFLVVFSPDGTKMASTHGNHNIYVTDIKTGKNIKTLVGHPRTPWCVAFHPTSNQIIASGCLGGQVRIWDLSGGSEVWTADSQTVIASIAFHPDDRVLVVATYNELYFWDWSKPEPFMHVATNNVKEKVRYVAFDKLGHKLITGISNSPQARWERVRAPVPIPRQIDRTANTYRRRITPRLISNFPPVATPQPPQRSNSARQPLSSVPERERRITQCYRNLVHEYELLVHRFLQIYRPPTMIDQGTDPMEVEHANHNEPTPGPSTSGMQSTNNTNQLSNNNGPSSSRNDAEESPAVESPGTSISNQPYDLSNIPSAGGAARVSLNRYSAQEYSSRRARQEERIRVFRRRCTLIRSTQTQAEQSVDTNDIGEQEGPENLSITSNTTDNNESNTENVSLTNDDANSPDSISNTTPSRSPRRLLVISRTAPEPKIVQRSNLSGEGSSKYNINIKCSVKRKSSSPQAAETVRSSESQSDTKKPRDDAEPSTSQESKPDAKEKKEPDSASNNNKGSLNIWHRMVRKRLHSTKKTFMPSSDSSSSDENSSTKRRPYSHKLASKVSQDKAKTKKSTAETKQPAAAGPARPSTSSNFRDSREFLNLNNQLEVLVTNLLNDNPRTSETQPVARIQQEIERICNTCGGTIRSDQNTEHSHVHQTRPETTNASRTRPLDTLSGPTAPLIPHHPSAFCPLATEPALREAHAQRVPPTADTTEQPLNLSAFHPFDPPPEFVSIHPENIGIGNMYSNIVQELESSLNDVRSIRANNRIGETSDMLSSFSERLESIMNQSNAILRNLHTSIDTILPEASEANTQDTAEEVAPAEPDPNPQPQLLFNDSSFYVREQRSEAEQERPLFDIQNVDESLDSSREASTSQTAIASDHTYPRNPRATRTSTSSMTPLIASLHFTVSHIQRQARLLRQQVESIEHIDRAMLEVAQLQMMRQMFSEIHRHFSNITANDRNSGVSSVRQMMAGTSISDSHQVNAPRAANANSTADSSSEQEASTSASHPSNSACRTRAHKSFPRCIFLMHRQTRRPHANLRQVSRDRSTRRHLYRRSFSCRAMPRAPIDLSTNRGRGFLNLFNPEALPSITRRLEHLLMEHGRYIGRSVDPAAGVSTSTEVGEHIVMLRLNNCRLRINRVLGSRESINNLSNTRINGNCVTRDGASRFGARQTLCSILDTLSRFVEVNTGNTLSANFRTHIWDVIELSLLLSEILLLQIVDSIPPPTGMNLDPERESLSARIDQMCSRMLQSRLSVQSHQLARSLRLMRLTVRHATHALGQTYTARRNAMLPSSSDNDRRRQLLDEINMCLRNIRRHRNVPSVNSTVLENTAPTNTMPMRNWYRTINDLISRYTTTRRTEDNTSSSTPRTTESDEQVEESSDTNQQVNNANNSSDSNDYNETDWFNNNIRRDNIRPLYRTSHMNLLDHNNVDAPAPPTFNSWNIPTVQVNDYSVNDVYSPWRPRAAFLSNRERLSERLSELRSNSTMGGFFRPRFLHPLYTGGNPFDADLDDNQREQIYDSDIITNMTPNHRIQIWEFASGNIPNINNSIKNIVVNECKIHNDASVDIASDGSVLVTLLPGGYLNVTNKLGVYSLEWETLGQCLYVASFEQNAVSVSLSPINRHLLVGLASRRVIMPNDRWTIARVFLLDEKGSTCGRLNSIRELEQTRDTNYMSVNCIRWLPISGQGLVYATNTGQLRILT